MSARIVAVNQTRSESESKDRAITVSVIDVEPRGVPPPPSYEQAIITQSEIERNRIQEQQRALEELVQEQNRLDRSRIEERNRNEERPVQQSSQVESIEQTSTTITTPPPTTATHQFVQREYSPQNCIEFHPKKYVFKRFRNSTDVYAVPPQVGPTPTNITCPSCHAAIKTRIEYVATAKTHLGALLCCAV